MAGARVRFEGSEAPTEILLDASSSTVTAADAATPFEIVRREERGGEIRIDQRLHTWRALRRGSKLILWVDGETHELELIERTAQRAGRSAAAGARNELVAPMPGQILKVNVAPGDSFEAHAPLIVMVSMKMELTISDPRPGVVRDVRCKPGDLVTIDQVLLVRADA